jgi:hypothetical protein
MAAIKMLLSNSWKFFQIKVPGTGFSFAVLAVGLLLVPISLSFLSLVLGFPVGTVDNDTVSLRSMGSRKYRVSSARKNDVR